MAGGESDEPPDPPLDAGRRRRLLFRSMRLSPDGLPELGPTARTLGVRTDLDPSRLHFDVRVDPITGTVNPGTGGLSVAPDAARNLPYHRLPADLGGGGNDPVFAIERGDLGPNLRYRPDPRRPTRHGFIEPSATMTIEQFQDALGNTRDRWVRYHPPSTTEAP